jgi:hypothetical protein
MTASMALFGNASFFFTAKNATESNYREAARSICQGNVPFARYFTSSSFSSFMSPCDRVNSDTNRNDYESTISELIHAFFAKLADTATAKEMLEISMFFANEIILTMTANEGLTQYSRTIYTDDGYQIQKPVQSIPAIVVISILLFLQVLGVTWLAVYNSSAPTWTATLDGLALTKIGRELRGAELSPLGIQDKKDIAELTETAGVVGVVKTDGESSPTGDDSTPRLGLGGPGVITRNMVGGKSWKEEVLDGGEDGRTI